MTSVRARWPRCETCGGPVLADDQSRWTDCEPCATTAATFERETLDPGSPDYAYHELAHHVVLCGRSPRRRADWRSVEWRIELFSVGRAQRHELRVLALQLAGARAMGWPTSATRLVDLSWSGIVDFEHDWAENGGRPVVRTRREAREKVRGLEPAVGVRNLATYVRAARRLRGERMRA